MISYQSLCSRKGWPFEYWLVMWRSLGIGSVNREDMILATTCLSELVLQSVIITAPCHTHLHQFLVKTWTCYQHIELCMIVGEGMVLLTKNIRAVARRVRNDFTGSWGKQALHRFRSRWTIAIYLFVPTLLWHCIHCNLVFRNFDQRQSSTRQHHRKAKNKSLEIGSGLHAASRRLILPIVIYGKTWQDVGRGMALPFGCLDQCCQSISPSFLHHYVQRLRVVSSQFSPPFDTSIAMVPQPCMVDWSFLTYSDYINPIDLCNRLNTYIVPEAAVQAFLTVLFLVNGYWIALVLNLPLLAYNAKK